MFWKKRSPAPEKKFAMYADGPDTIKVCRIPWIIYGYVTHKRQDGESDEAFAARVRLYETDWADRRDNLKAATGEDL